MALGLLAVCIAAGGAARAAPDAPSATHARAATASTRDGDRDGLFDDLEARLAKLSIADTVDVLVETSAPASAARVAALERHVGGFSTKRRFALAHGFAATLTREQAAALAAQPDVDHVELDATVHAFDDTGAASFGVTKARLDAPGLDGNTDGNPDAYSPGDMVAAVVDSGIDVTHVDLDQGKVIGFADFVNGRTAPYDDNGHGTHVAATLAGDGDARPDHAYRGVAPGAALVGVKVLGSNGIGSEDAVIAGLEWVVANRSAYGIDVVNVSLGSDGCSDGTDLVSQAVDAAVAAGLVVVVAAGNEGPAPCTIGSPGAARSALTVGAMADLRHGGFALASFSSRGPTADGRVKPDVVGPGVGVISAAARTTNEYTPMNGTSSASPFVAGVALLMRQANPSLTPAQVKTTIASTAIDWGASGADPEFGAGRLDAYAALKAAGAALATGPDVPEHTLRTGTLAGPGSVSESALEVTDVRFPIAATLTIPSLASASGSSPNFDVYLYGPDGSPLGSGATSGRQELLAFQPEATGTYVVRVVSAAGSGPFVLDISAGTGSSGQTVPGAPVLSTAVGGYASVTLSWSAPFSGNLPLTGYRVYRSPASGGSEALIASIGAVPTFTDTKAANGSSYRYRVSAVNALGEGPRSNELPGAPKAPLFFPYDSIPTGSPGMAVALGDVTGDGRADAVLTTGWYSDVPNDLKLLVFAQNPDGTLAAPVAYPTAATYSRRAHSVAIGDITGDGRPDVVVGVPGTGAEVFPQLASGLLGSPVDYATGGWQVRVGEFNGDGRLDVASVDVDHHVMVLLNDGHGGLGPATTYPADAGGDLEVGDVTGDGRDDIVAFSGAVTVLAQQPGGGLAAPVSYPKHSAYTGNAIGIGDVTGDGRNDVVGTFGGNRPTASVEVFAQTPAGTLASSVAYPSYDIPGPVGIADFDGDGRGDVITFHAGWEKAGVYRQTASGGLAAEELLPIPYGNIYEEHGVGIGDVNGDGVDDVVFTSDQSGLLILRGSAAVPPTATVPGVPTLKHAYSGKGQVTLEWTAPASAGGSVITGYAVYRGSAGGPKTLLTTVGVVTAFTDVSAVNGTAYDYAISAVNPVGEGPRSNELSAIPATTPGAPTLVSADAGDGEVALHWLAPTSNGGGAITDYRIYRSDAGGTLRWVDTSDGPGTTFTDTVVNTRTYAYRIVAENSAGPGPQSNEWSATPLSSSPLFEPYRAFEVGSPGAGVAVGDVTGDGRADVVLTTGYVNHPATDFHLWVFAQSAGGELTAPVSYATAASYTHRTDSVAVGDVTGDGRNDVLVAVAGIGLQVYAQLPSGSLGPPTTLGSAAEKVRLGRLNGDGLLDAAVYSGCPGGPVCVFPGDGHGGLGAPAGYDVDNGGLGDLEVDDVTGDGRADLVVMSGQGLSPNVSVLPQLAQGGFGPPAAYRIDTTYASKLTHGIGAGDVTGDGRDDVVASLGGDRPSSSIAVFAQTLAGTLGTAVNLPSYDGPEAIEVADLDGDGRDDIAVAHPGIAVGVYRQRPDGTLAREDLYLSTDGGGSSRHGLAIGDVNGDGAPDLVAADTAEGLVVLLNTGPAGAAAVPAAPALTAATPGTGRVDLAWTAPASDGGSAISNYRIYRGVSGGQRSLLATVSAQTLAYADTSAVPGATYDYEVGALNASGEGPRSNVRTATPLSVSLPGAPELSAVAGDGRVDLTWVDGPDGGAPITGYRLYRGVAGGAKTLLAALGVVHEYTDSTVASGTAYAYGLSAVTAAGAGPVSAERVAQPSAPAGAPTLAATAGNGTVVLSWKVPEATGGHPISGYRVYRRFDGGSWEPIATLGTVTGFTDPDVPNGLGVSYRVAALTADGEGPSSNEVTAVPSGPPLAPLLTGAVAGSAGITLTWADPDAAGADPTGGSPIAAYRIYRGTGAGARTLLATVEDGSLTYTDTSAHAGVGYSYEVSAVNELGESPRSNGVQTVAFEEVTGRSHTTPPVAEPRPRPSVPPPAGPTDGRRPPPVHSTG